MPNTAEATRANLNDFIVSLEELETNLSNYGQAETFGVDASAPAGGVVMAAGPAAGGAEEAAEKTEFDLVITDVDASKRIAIIKVVRGLTSLGLKEAKDAVTNLPFTILEGKTKGEVEEAMKELEAGGAKCEMK